MTAAWGIGSTMWASGDGSALALNWHTLHAADLTKVRDVSTTEVSPPADDGDYIEFTVEESTVRVNPSAALIYNHDLPDWIQSEAGLPRRVLLYRFTPRSEPSGAWMIWAGCANTGTGGAQNNGIWGGVRHLTSTNNNAACAASWLATEYTSSDSYSTWTEAQIAISYAGRAHDGSEVGHFTVGSHMYQGEGGFGVSAQGHHTYGGGATPNWSAWKGNIAISYNNSVLASEVLAFKVEWAIAEYTGAAGF